MYPEVFGIIKSFGLMMAISFAVGLWLSIRRGRVHGVPSETITDLIFAVLVSSLVGVRLLYVVTHLGDFQPWYRAFFLWDGGLTLYGGIVLSTVTVWWLARRRGVPFLVIADIFSPGVILGIGITRIGCFLAGCCYGLPTHAACGLRFPAGSPASDRYGELAVHPTQLYASAAGFLIFGLLLLWERWYSPRGATFARFLVLYGLARFGEDFLRYYEPDQFMALGWTNNQWISLAWVAGGLIMLVVLHRRAGREDAVAA